MRNNILQLDSFGFVMKSIRGFFYGVVHAYLSNFVRIYFSFLFFLFLFIYYCNTSGLIPFNFTVTSHFAVTFMFAFLIWYGAIGLGITNHNLRFVLIFFPKGVALNLTMVISCLELLSYVFRVVSLCVRLGANMIAGHIMIDCIIVYLYGMILHSLWMDGNLVLVYVVVIGFWFALLLGFIVYEVVVCFLQSYIFIVLSSLYLKEVI
jgi:F-type H+-transporting ATPase subunit a